MGRLARFRAESEERMNWKWISAVSLGAALLAAAPVQAAGCKKDSDCGSSQTCSKGTCVVKAASKAAASASKAANDTSNAVAPTNAVNAGTKRTGIIGWGGLGLYSVGGSGAFALHVGGAVNLMPLTPDLPLVAWGDFGMGFFSGGTAFPIKLGAGVRYDKAGPMQLLAGAAFTVMPTTVSVTPVGVALMGMILYPLPQLNPNLSAQLQIGYDILSDGFGTFEFTVGAGWAF
jgi:hypothetical protein